MPELSNMLRQKLGEAQNEVETHPDADTLTALTEQLLPAAERQQVLKHLSACGQCREILALSQPQLPELVTQPVIKPARVSGWRKLFTPTFGLAATAVAMAIIAVVVLQVPQKPSQQSKPEAKAIQPLNVAPDAQASPVTPAQPSAAAAPSNQPEAATSNIANSDSRRRVATAAPPPPSRTASANNAAAAINSADKSINVASPQAFRTDLSRRDYVNPGIIFAANATESPNGFVSSPGLSAAPQPQSLATEAKLSAGLTGGQLAFKDLPPSPPANKKDMHLFTPSEPQDHFWSFGKLVQKSARGLARHTPSVPPMTANSLSFSAMGEPGKYTDQLEKAQPAEVAAAPSKPADIDGLARFEGLNRRSMAAADADSAAVLWKVLGGKLVRSSGPGQWEDAYPGAGFQFAIVSARGNDVWAGGTQASVIHSRDGGKTWEAAKLGSNASGTVVSILFSGTIVQVRTSEDQSWLSSDGGKTWIQN